MRDRGGARSSRAGSPTRRCSSRLFARRALCGRDVRRGRRSTRGCSSALDGARRGRVNQRLNRCFYLSTAPTFFPVIVEQLGEQGLNRLEGAEVRVIIEKPFGDDAGRGPGAQPRACCRCSASTRSSASTITWARRPSRTSWPSASPTACSSRCGTATTSTNVQITAAEDIGIGTRAGYYDSAGALRDLIQNHMLQLLCHVAMEPPVDFTADEVRNEKVKVLHAIPAPTPTASPTWRCAGSTRPARPAASPSSGYAEEEGVPGDSRDRDVRRDPPGGRQLALGGRAVLPAHGQAPGAQGHRDRRHAASPSRTSASPRTARSACAPTSSSSPCSPTRASRCRSRPRSPGRGCGSAP